MPFAKIPTLRGTVCIRRRALLIFSLFTDNLSVLYRSHEGTEFINPSTECHLNMHSGLRQVVVAKASRLGSKCVGRLPVDKNVNTDVQIRSPHPKAGDRSSLRIKDTLVVVDGESGNERNRAGVHCTARRSKAEERFAQKRSEGPAGAPVGIPVVRLGRSPSTSALASRGRNVGCATTDGSVVVVAGGVGQRTGVAGRRPRLRMSIGDRSVSWLLARSARGSFRRCGGCARTEGRARRSLGGPLANGDRDLFSLAFDIRRSRLVRYSSVLAVTDDNGAGGGHRSGRSLCRAVL